MTRTKVESSHVVSIGHDGRKELKVEFKGGELYRYLTREQVRRLEWAGCDEGEDLSPWSRCPACHNLHYNGHGPACWLAAAITGAAGMEEKDGQ